MKIIESLQEQIKTAKSLDEPLNEVSWNYQHGILISIQDAEDILKILKSSCNKSKEDIFNTLKKEILKGALQERLGYDLYDKVLNKDYDKLNQLEQQRFDAFLVKEGYSISA